MPKAEQFVVTERPFLGHMGTKYIFLVICLVVEVTNVSFKYFSRECSVFLYI